MVTWENTFKEIEDAKPEVAVIAIGALEQHSTFLPIGTDFLMGDHIARKVAEKLDAFLLPVMPYGNSQEHQDFFGTIWLQPSTLALVFKDVCHSLKHHGIRKVLVINAHGGNWIIKPTVREINLNDPEMTVVMAGPGADNAALLGAKIELHCTTAETALMMAVFPELVKGKGEDFQPDIDRTFLDYVGLRAASPTGVWGTPSKATVEMGRQNIEQIVDTISNYAKETFAQVAAIKARKGIG